MGRDGKAEPRAVTFETVVNPSREQIITMFVNHNQPEPAADQALAARLSKMEGEIMSDSIDPNDWGYPDFDYPDDTYVATLADANPPALPDDPITDGLDDLHRYHEEETEPFEESARSITLTVEPTNWTITIDGFDEVSTVRWYPSIGRMDVAGPRSFYRTWYDLPNFTAGLDIVVPLATQVLRETQRIYQSQERIDRLATDN